MSTSTEEEVKRYFAYQDDGSLLSVYHIEGGAFGVVGSRNLVGLIDSLKRERKASFSATKAMLKAFRILNNADEDILSISVGSDKGGRDVIVVSTIWRATPEGSEL